MPMVAYLGTSLLMHARRPIHEEMLACFESAPIASLGT
jgi:hypothetical protein